MDIIIDNYIKEIVTSMHEIICKPAQYSNGIYVILIGEVGVIENTSS